MEFKRQLPSAQAIRQMYPLSPVMAGQKQENDLALRRIFQGEDDRLALIIGPCSADREDAVLEYARRLHALQDEVRERLFLVLRVYSNKPRTTGDGYKGMLHQPSPTASPDLLRGLIATRRLHIAVLEQTGLPTADEMLYPDNHPYLSDCLSYVAVGARSVEDQLHRLTASGLDVPVGMKNPTGGSLAVMMNAITAAQHPHAFTYSGWEVRSRGNLLAHAILRGYADQTGKTVPNYHFEDLQQLLELYQKSGLQNPAVIVDTNHANSGKQWHQQPRIALEVLHSMRRSPAIRQLVKGLMVESYLEDGCQSPDGSVYGQSITDPCLGWEKTRRLVCELAEAL